MNEIKVDKLKDEVVKLNKLIDDYEDNYLNMYHEIMNSNSDWIDGNSITFFSEKDLEKQKRELGVDELKNVSNIYQYIASSYETLANNIKYDLDKKNTINSEINEYIKKINSIIRDYSNLSTKYVDSSIRIAINNEITKLRKTKSKAKILRNTLEEIFNNIEEIEKNVNSKISQIKIDIITQNNPERFY
ncbi:MAG: hypothetical protein IJ565_01380 [Bacilli bacterium]|nr:hypothetical protein [Bacilli bacterium]